MKIITNVGDVRIEASSHEEFMILLRYALLCSENNKKQELIDLQTRGERKWVNAKNVGR